MGRTKIAGSTSCSSCVLLLLLFALHFWQAQSFLFAPFHKRRQPPAVLFSSSQDDLLHSLQDWFDYEGRLPSIDDFHCGFVSIIGAPNMGKSTLLNALLQHELSVTTKRPQTTRHAILGILNSPDKISQVCLVDTPGIIDEPAYKLQEGMMEAVVGALTSADILLVVTDLFSTPIPDDDLLQRVQDSRKPVLVAINKIDLADRVNASVEKEEEEKTLTVPEAVAKWRSIVPNALVILPMSASEGSENVGVVALRKILCGEEGVPAALRDLGRPIPGMFRPGVKSISDEEAKALLPKSPPLYDQEMLTDRPERFFASEMIRASLFQKLKKELPYCCEVRVTEFKEPKPDAKQVIRMKATVFVERDSQKIIVIGKGGQVIKAVGMEARKQLEDFFQMQVHLELSVKVDKDWRKNESRLKQLGYLK